MRHDCSDRPFLKACPATLAREARDCTRAFVERQCSARFGCELSRVHAQR
ncbi:unnamed protein product [Ixodes persulcatus]